MPNILFYRSGDPRKNGLLRFSINSTAFSEYSKFRRFHIWVDIIATIVPWLQGYPKARVERKWWNWATVTNTTSCGAFGCNMAFSLNSASVVCVDIWQVKWIPPTYSTIDSAKEFHNRLSRTALSDQGRQALGLQKVAMFYYSSQSDDMVNASPTKSEGSLTNTCTPFASVG